MTLWRAKVFAMFVCFVSYFFCSPQNRSTPCERAESVSSVTSHAVLSLSSKHLGFHLRGSGPAKSAARSSQRGFSRQVMDACCPFYGQLFKDRRLQCENSMKSGLCNSRVSGEKWLEICRANSGHFRASFPEESAIVTAKFTRNFTPFCMATSRVVSGDNFTAALLQALGDTQKVVENPLQHRACHIVSARRATAAVPLLLQSSVEHLDPWPLMTVLGV